LNTFPRGQTPPPSTPGKQNRMWDHLCSPQKVDYQVAVNSQDAKRGWPLGNVFKCCTEISSNNMDPEALERARRADEAQNLEPVKLKQRMPPSKKPFAYSSSLHNTTPRDSWGMDVPSQNENESGDASWFERSRSNSERMRSAPPVQQPKKYSWDDGAQQLRRSLQTLRDEHDKCNTTGKSVKKNSVATGSHLADYMRRRNEVCTTDTHQALKERVEQWAVQAHQSRVDDKIASAHGAMLVKTGSKHRLGHHEQWVRQKASWGVHRHKKQ